MAVKFRESPPAFVYISVELWKEFPPHERKCTRDNVFLLYMKRFTAWVPVRFRKD